LDIIWKPYGNASGIKLERAYNHHNVIDIYIILHMKNKNNMDIFIQGHMILKIKYQAVWNVIIIK
jgi:hypothetical protein